MSSNKKAVSAPETSGDLFAFQLGAVRLYEVEAARCLLQKDKPEGAVFGFKLARSDEPLDAKEFGVLLSFEGTIPVGGKQACRIKLSVEGRFVTTVNPADLKTEAIQQFRQLDAAVLLWPYLRQYVHDLTTRLGLDLPPLPTMDVRALLSRNEAPEAPAPE